MEIVIRIALIYLFLLIALRLMGKREFGQLSPFELVTLLIIPEIFTESVTKGETSMTLPIIGIATLLSLVFLTSLLAYRFPAFERVSDSDPVLLVHHGYLIPSAMHHERVSPQEILSEMHKAGLERMEQVKWGVLEPDGKISFVPWEQGEVESRDDEHLPT